MGAAGFVAEYFAADKPMAISSRRTRRILKPRFDEQPDSLFGNNRGVPLPESWEQNYLDVGGMHFMVDKIHGHQSGDMLVFLDKGMSKNADLAW